jgi:hypothetical protein
VKAFGRVRARRIGADPEAWPRVNARRRPGSREPSPAFWVPLPEWAPRWPLATDFLRQLATFHRLELPLVPSIGRARLGADLLRQLATFHRSQHPRVPRGLGSVDLLRELTAFHRLQLLHVQDAIPTGVVMAAGRSSVARVTINPATPPMPRAMATAIAIAPTLNLPTGADSTLALMRTSSVNVGRSCARAAPKSVVVTT